MNETKIIPRKHKYLFWLNLGLLSTFFAEVISGSDLFPFFHGWGILMTVPLYLLHTLVLLTLVFRNGRPTLPVLYFAGTLFGLYEAYITKILWNPSWGTVFKIADVAVFETIVLVLFWHVWMSFILPLLAADAWLTRMNEILPFFSQRLQNLFRSRKGWVLVAVSGGLFVTINLPTPGHALVSGLGVVVVLGFSGWLWRRMTREYSYTIEDLLPNKREFIFLAIWLLCIYLLTGFTLRIEALPSLTGHVTIWVLYSIFTLLFCTALRYSRKVELMEEELPVEMPSQFWIWGLLIFFIVGSVVEGLAQLLPLELVIDFICWYGVVLLGIFMLVWTLRLLFRERKKMKRLSVITVLMMLLLIFVMACRNTAPANAAAPVELAPVNAADIVSKGDRILQIDVNEGVDGDYDAALQIARAAGAEAVSMSLGWDDIETGPGEFNPQTNWLEIANAYYPAQGVAVSLVISPIDTNVERRPVDLRDRPYDDEEVIARYNALLDYIHEQTPDLQLTSLSIGNEINATLGDDAEAWQLYTNFFAATSAHARTLWPDVPVGSKVMYGAATGKEREFVLALADFADILMITYYPLDEKYQVLNPADVEADLQQLTCIYEGKPIFLAEVGYPSSQFNGSSAEKQAEFVNHIFNAWDDHAGQIQLISFTFQTELSPERVSALEDYYGYSNKAFAEYLRTLGMRTYDGQDKPAWLRLNEEAGARGW